MAEAGRRSGAPDESSPNTQGEVLAALQLWQTFEYLSPQNPPEPKLEKDYCIWDLDPHAEGDGEMPWIAATKLEQLDRLFEHKRRYVLYAGLIGGKELVETARELLDAPPLDFSEQRAPESTASFVIPLNETGRVSGEVFVSTVPWAMACLKVAQRRPGLLDFSGFFGDQGVQKRIKAAVNDLLVVRQLIPADPSSDETEVQLGETSAEPEVAVDEMSSDPFADGAESGGKPQQVRALTAEDVRAIADVVFTTCGWRPEGTPKWIIQTLRAPTKDQDRVADDPLNSFYAEELEKVQAEYLEGRCGATLRQYLEMPVHPERCDLESSRHFLVNGVHPTRTPLACWPGEHPLVTAQQFAVNTTLRELKEGGLFSVNGPPGTGKTTMLKDLLAAIVAERADVLESFAHPLDALPTPLKIEGHKYPVWKLHDRLRGFGIVVACANNGAAENISKDLPGLSAVDKTLNLDYFSEVADSLGMPKKVKKRPQRRWGLVSAALGKQENKLAFAAEFWDGPKDEKKARPRKAAEKPQQPEVPPDPLRPFTLQEWVQEFGATVPPWNEARARYAQARDRAESALKRVGDLANRLRASEVLSPRLAQLRALHADLVATATELARRESAAKVTAEAAGGLLERSKFVVSALRALAQHQLNLQAAQRALDGIRQDRPQRTLEELDEGIARTERARDRVKADGDDHRGTKPGAISAFFRKENLQRWEARRSHLDAELDTKRQQLEGLELARDQFFGWQRSLADGQTSVASAHAQAEAASKGVRSLQLEAGLTLEKADAQFRAAESDLKQRQDELRSLQRQAAGVAADLRAAEVELREKAATFDAHQVELARAGLLEGHRPAWHLFDGPRDDFHKASPYHDDRAVFHARRDLFAAALDLHKAFIVHAWSRLKPTLYGSVGVLTGRFNANQIPGGPMPLWDTLFLVVPLVSTTFASFPRLFRGVGKEQLAWVLIDEAGQAAPQYCAGALWRARRAVIVGDPLQLEPVVGIPVELAAPLQARCGADARYVPPGASAQTLADQSNRYGTYLNEDDPERRIWLGSPLIVHRRCIAPMFEISNAIAYQNMMVDGAVADRPGHAAHPSFWADATTEGNEGHWVPGQAARALKAVRMLVGDQLRNEEGKLRVFVITPFTDSAEKMKQLLKKEYGWDDAKDMCGTVHAFQGKEADYVVFLLGGDPRKPGVISGFAGRSPNLVNVAVTRAKKRLYVLGNREYWTGRGDVHGYFRQMACSLDRHVAALKTKGDSR